jgi:hypothetical protein
VMIYTGFELASHRVAAPRSARSATPLGAG